MPDVKLTLLVTYSVVSDPDSLRILERIKRDFDCEIGAHLHPEETPPFTRSFPDGTSLMRLPFEARAEKLRALTDAISAHFPRPISYRAGRWKLSPEDVGLLAKQGLGNALAGREVETAVCRSGLPFERRPDVEQRVAALVAEGKVVARVTGASEYGPRALGNRSILCSAADPSVNDWLNARLKRSEFMPFAPITLYEERDACYRRIAGAEHAARFMTITFDCTAEMRQAAPAAVHVDGTARPQLVEREVSPGLHALLTEYRRLTGNPSLINTSFNMHEEPIVASADDAVRTFLRGGLDYLAIDDFLVRNPETDAPKG